MKKKLRYILGPAFTLSFGASRFFFGFFLYNYFDVDLLRRVFFGSAFKTASPSTSAQAPARVSVGGPTGRMSVVAAC